MAKPVTYKDFIPNHYLAKYKQIVKENKGKELPPRILIDEIQGSEIYHENNKSQVLERARSVFHNGQRKLLLTEIQHMIHYLDTMYDEALVIYAGSAPSNKAIIYKELFPNTKFLFVDPNEHNIYTNGYDDTHYSYPVERNGKGGDVVYITVPVGNNTYPYKKEKEIIHYKNPTTIINRADMTDDLTREDDFIDFVLDSTYTYYIFEEYMTKELSEKLNTLLLKYRKEKPNAKILFWSDIRTNIRETVVSDVDVMANTAMNYVWLKTLTKDLTGQFNSMLKFRVPFMDGESNPDWNEFQQQVDEAKELGVDFVEMYNNGKFKWFNGEIYTQAWSKVRSTECRLWSSLKDIQLDLVEYDIHEHEDKLFYYNLFERFGMKFENDYADRELGFDHCGDCSIESKIWSDYVDKFRPNLIKERFIHSMVKKVGWLTRRGLKRYPHGSNF